MTRVVTNVGTTVGTRLGTRVSKSEQLCEVRENKRGKRRILEQLREFTENKHGDRRIKGTQVGIEVSSSGMEQDP